MTDAVKQGEIMPIARIAAAAALGLTLAACGGADSGGALEGPPTTPATTGAAAVSVALAEWSVTPTPSTAPAGAVGFSVSNGGTMDHEFVVIATDLAPDALPQKDGAVDESAESVDVVTRVEPFSAGTSATKNITLEAGSYALICNVPGHYGAGMRSSFTVT